MIEYDNKTWEAIYLRMAFDFAGRSHCSRKQVGCVITSVDHAHVYGAGYNGREAGGPNECARPEESGNCGCLHAEDNAILKVSETKDIPKIAYITDQPCEYCARRIVNKGGFTRVVYKRHYRLDSGVNILRNRGIEVSNWWGDLWKLQQ